MRSPVHTVIADQKTFFASGRTKEARWRLSRLAALEKLISENEAILLDSFARDLGKPRVEAYASEIAVTLAEVRTARRHLRGWMRSVRRPAPLFAQPCVARDYPVPFGSVLIVGPWNYPFNLVAAPLVSALAAGNCCVLKPSEHAPRTAHTIARLCERSFARSEVACVTGGPNVTRRLIDTRPDFVFFTGGTAAGRKVLEQCGRRLIPTVAELSGCNPAIVDRDVDVRTCARRIGWAKFFNAGQTCLAPNACWVHETLVERFTRELIETVRSFYDGDSRRSKDYARIVNARHVGRLKDLLGRGGGTIVCGGEIVPEERYVSPTVVRLEDRESPLVKEEIFGPVLPILGYKRLDEVVAAVRSGPEPLIVYLYSQDKEARATVREGTVSGSFAVNAGFEMVTATALPFGGVGAGGMGRYHGRFGFEAFSYRRAELRKPLWPEIGIRYPPYRAPFALVKRALRLLV